MIERPIDPPKQTTPPNQSSKSNTGNFGGGNSTNININKTQDNSLLNQILDQLSELQTDPATDIPIAIQISPADTASVPASAFLSVAGPLTAGLVDFQLPANFIYTLSPVSGGKYGTVITSDTGQQSVSVDVSIEDVNGIIDYEVRLVKNG